ncbi:WbqC family protein [Halobacteriovorax sp. RT-2-4]|uniref:WbqC family protein n=1 Tax=unclassified Halobacteriovorax TaxID=2639665 RepID=UPI00399A18B0
MQPYFLPYLGYIQLIASVDNFVIFDDVNFIKRGWINRNNIIVNKEKKLITLSLKKASINKKINEIDICSDSIENLRKTLLHSYSKSLYGIKMIDYLFSKDICQNTSLSIFLENQLKKVTSLLDLKTVFYRSSEFKISSELKGQDRIIEICKALKTTEYFNLPGGRDLYSDGPFNDNGIDLKFIELPSFVYEQGTDLFIPYLSIIDVLSNSSISEIKSYLDSKNV